MTLADTPPMGWNSWDCDGTTVTEDGVLANARFLAEHLASSGWDTVGGFCTRDEPAHGVRLLRFPA